MEEEKYRDYDEEEFLAESLPEPSPDLTRWQLTSEDILDDLEHDLRGEYFDKNSNKWKRGPWLEKLLNEKGIRMITSLMRTRINKIAFLSNLSEDDINDMCLSLSLDLADLFFLRYKDLGASKENLSIIVSKVMDIVFVALRRAKDEGERKFLKTTEKRLEKIIRGDKEKKERFGWVPFLGGRGD